MEERERYGGDIDEKEVGKPGKQTLTNYKVKFLLNLNLRQNREPKRSQAFLSQNVLNTFVTAI